MTGVVVRLELPDVDGDGRQHADHSGSGSPRSSDPAHGLDHQLTGGGQPAPTLDPDPVRIARAIEDLLRALAPALTPRIRVEVTSVISPPAAPPSSAVVTPDSGRWNPDSTPDPTSEPADGLRLDLRSRTLTVDGQPATLTRREFDLLAYLHQRPGVAFSRPDLMTAVWRTGHLEGDRTVDVHVRRVRLKLGRHAHRLSTLRGFGYRFD